MFRINVNKLLYLMPQYDINNLTIWTDEPISLSCIKNAANNLESLDVPFSDERDRIAHGWEKEEHLRRILYFIENQEEIKGVTIDNEVVNGVILPRPVIPDGNHRLMAAAYLGFSYIDDCLYNGRKDVFSYLIDQTDILPA